MDPDIIVAIGLAPVYGACVAAMWWSIAFGWHMLRRIDESASKTALTETVKTGNNAVATPPK